MWRSTVPEFTILYHFCKRELPKSIFAATASAAWGAPSESVGSVLRWRPMDWDARVGDYGDCGFVVEQVSSNTNIEICPGG